MRYRLGPANSAIGPATAFLKTSAQFRSVVRYVKDNQSSWAPDVLLGWTSLSLSGLHMPPTSYEILGRSTREHQIRTTGNTGCGL